MKKFTSQTQKTGELGEQIAVRFLKDRGFEILERNYTRSWGEIDIVVRKKGWVHFIEVKSITYENIEILDNNALYRPEEQMHIKKQERLSRIIETYIVSRDVKEWRFDLLCVFLDQKHRRAKVRAYWDLILA